MDNGERSRKLGLVRQAAEALEAAMNDLPHIPFLLQHRPVDITQLCDEERKYRNDISIQLEERVK